MCAFSVNASSSTVVIAEVYGGGGGTSGTPTYNRDYVILFNKSASPQSINGWSVQYGSSAGTTWQVTALPNTNMPPGTYLLVGESSGSAGGALSGVDVSGSISMSATAGKIALVNSTTALSGANPAGTAGVVDLVGYGAANGYEGTGPVATLSTTTAAIRNSNGCTDSDSNSADFTVGTPTGRNSGSPVNNCGGSLSGFLQVETKADGTGTVVPAQSLTAGNSITVYAIQRDNSSNFVANTAADSWSLSKSGAVAAGDLVPSGDLKSAVFTGHGAGTASITANSSTATTVSSGLITVTATSAAQVRVETKADGTGVVVPAQTVVSGNSVTMYAIRRDTYGNFIDNVAATSWTVPTTTGSAASTDLVVASDSKSATFIGNQPGTATVRATSGALTTTDSGVLTIVARTIAPVVISQAYGGGGNSGSSYVADFVELFNRTGNPVDMTGWSVQYASSTGTGYAGVAAITNVTTIPPYSYYLLKLATGTNGSPDFAADLTNTTVNLAAGGGKVALANVATNLGAVTVPDPRVIDFVGYGANQFEGTGAAPGTSDNATSVLRANGGCTDTDNNAADFATSSPNPRTTANSSGACPPNAPTISSIPTQAIDSSATVGPLTFTVNDVETAATALTVTATSDNTTLLPNANISLGGSGVVRNITLHPVSNQTGSAQVTVTVKDGDNMTASKSFYLFVGTGPNLGIVFADDFSAYADGQWPSFVGDAFGGAWHTTSGTPYQIVVSNQQAYVSIPTTNSEDIAAGFTNGAVSVNSGAILYTGCKLTQTALPTGNGEYFLHLKDGTTSNFFCRLFATPIGAANGKFRLGLSNKSTTGPNVVFPVDLDLNTTYNVAMRYKVSIGASTLWVNPSSINDSSVSASDTPNLLADISQVALREPGTTNTPSIAGSQIIDNLVVSTSFSDVVTLTAAPPTLKATQNASSLTITWPTNNNSGFVLQSASTVNATTWNPVGGVTTSGANYTVTVPFTSTPAFFRLKK